MPVVSLFGTISCFVSDDFPPVLLRLIFSLSAGFPAESLADCRPEAWLPAGEEFGWLPFGNPEVGGPEVDSRPPGITASVKFGKGFFPLPTPPLEDE